MLVSDPANKIKVNSKSVIIKTHEVGENFLLDRGDLRKIIVYLEHFAVIDTEVGYEYRKAIREIPIGDLSKLKLLKAKIISNHKLEPDGSISSDKI